MPLCRGLLVDRVASLNRGGRGALRGGAHRLLLGFAVGFRGLPATIQLAHALAAWSDSDPAALDHATTFIDGLSMKRLLDAARRSADERRWIEL